jgi:hypothetical protein
MATELRDEFDQTLPEGRIYWTDDPWRHPSVPRQLRESLARQRRHGVPFDLAWRLAVGHLAHDHDWTSRHQWLELLADPEFRAIWEAAYTREPLPLLAATNLLRRALDDAQPRDAERKGRPLRRPGRPPRHLA